MIGSLRLPLSELKNSLLEKIQIQVWCKKTSSSGSLEVPNSANIDVGEKDFTHLHQ
jgi:hypothetical protein